MKYLFYFFLIGLLLFSKLSFSQEKPDYISEKLCILGFENVNVISTTEKTLLCFENNVFTWDVEAIARILDIVSAKKENTNVELYLLKHAVPQVCIKVNMHYWQEYRKAKISKAEIEKLLIVSYDIGPGFKKLETDLYWNSNINKIDFVFYPQLFLQNTGFNQIYETQINIAPAMELDMWKGMKFTGQVIIPLVNDYGKEGDEIRPGFITIAQSFRLRENYFGKVSIGNFNASRYGMYSSMGRSFFKNRLEVRANLGITGSSHFYKGRWINGSLSKLSWFLKSNYFHSKYGLELGLSYGRYMNKDYGVRADFIRHFKSVAIGFYALYSGSDFNGGFNFTIPLPSKKRNRKRMIRIMPANYFDWEYNAGTEFVKGKFYETRPNTNRTEYIFNPIYIKTQLLNL